MQVGQGDNVIIVAKIPKIHPEMSEDEYVKKFKDNIRKESQDYLKNLKDISKGLGMIIKLEETWYSTVLLNYGKEILFDEAYMSGVLKKMSRMYQDVSDTYPSISNRVSAQRTSMHSATLKGFDPIVPYLISLVEISLLFKREYKHSLNLGLQVKTSMIKRRVRIDNDFILFLLLMPSTLNGLPIMCPLDLLYRGHPDPVTGELMWLKWLASEGVLTVQKILYWVTSIVGISTTRNFTMLIQDPLALNVKRPQQATNVIKNTLESALELKAINKDIKLL